MIKLIKQPSLIVFVLFFVLFGVIYSPVFSFNYLYHDDAFFWAKPPQWQGSKHFVFDISMGMGRYAMAYVLTWEGWIIHRVPDLIILRTIALVLLTLSACVVFKYLCRISSLPRLHAFLVVAAMFEFPSFQEILSYTVGSFLFLALLLACFAFERIYDKGQVFAASIALLLAITIYPPWAMFYWALLTLPLIFNSNNVLVLQRQRIAQTVAVGFLALGIFVILLYSIKNFFLGSVLAPSPLYNPYLISIDLWKKLWWLLHEPLINALNLWDVYPQQLRGWVVVGIMLSTLGWQEFKTRRLLQVPSYGRLGFIVAVAILTFLPNLAAKQDAPFYRCLVGLTAVIWFGIVWAIKQWVDEMPAKRANTVMLIFLSAAVVYGGARAFNNLLYLRVLPSHVEWEAYHMMAQNVTFRHDDAVLVVVPLHDGTTERYDEFGTLSSQYPEDIFPIIKAAFKEKKDGKFLPQLLLTFPQVKENVQYKEYYYRRYVDGKVIFQEVGNIRDWRVLDKISIEAYRCFLPQGIFATLTPIDLSQHFGRIYIIDLRDIKPLEAS